LHWIDPTSRELLDLTVEKITGLPVLLVATYRPDFQPPWVGGCAGDGDRAEPAWPQ
jgi:predicted ATPase